MESLSGNQVKDLKELYASIYKSDDQEISEEEMKDEKKNIKKEIEDKKIEKEAEKKEEPITINLPNGGTKKIYPASDEYKKIKSGELTTSKSNSSMITDITNIKKNEKGEFSGTVEKPKVSAMGVDVNKIEKDTKDAIEKDKNPSGKVIPKPTKPLMKNSPAAKAGIPIETRQKFANQNAAFQATKNKDSGYSKMDFIKDFPNSQTAKKFNKGERIPGFSYKKNLKNSYEPYHIVLGYVLSEGHAETVEEAHYVMGQMDSETIQEIVALDENLAANVARTAGVLTLGGLGLNAIRKMFQNKKKMDNDGEFTPGSTLDNIQKKNKMLKDLNTGNY